MILEKIKEHKNFTKTDEAIAAFLLENSFEVSELTANELGRKTFTSKASVFRFCKKIGVNGYENMRRQFEKEITERSRLKELLKQEPLDKKSSLKEVVNGVHSLYEASISETKMKLDMYSLSRIVSKLRLADTIDIYGSGITESIASAAKFKFLSIGKDCNVHTGVNEHYIMANKNKHTIAILLSFTGQNPGAIRIAKYLKKVGVFLLGIGGTESSDFKDLCDEYIETFNKALVMSMEVISPYTSMMYIFDMLFAAVLIKDYERNFNNSIDVIQNKFIEQPDKTFYKEYLEKNTSAK